MAPGSWNVYWGARPTGREPAREDRARLTFSIWIDSRSLGALGSRKPWSPDGRASSLFLGRPWKPTIASPYGRLISRAATKRAWTNSAGWRQMGLAGSVGRNGMARRIRVQSAHPTGAPSQSVIWLSASGRRNRARCGPEQKTASVGGRGALVARRPASLLFRSGGRGRRTVFGRVQNRGRGGFRQPDGRG